MTKWTQLTILFALLPILGCSSMETQKEPSHNNDTLLARSLEIASLEAQLKKRRASYDDAVIRISGNSQNPYERDYVDRCVEKIAKVGNYFYPKDVRSLEGSARVQFSINRSGTIEKIRILRSSGHEALDLYIYKTLKAAQPYPAFPAEISSNIQKFVITRYFDFSKG